MKKFEKPFWSHRNELIGLDFFMKVAMDAEQLCTRYVQRISR